MILQITIWNLGLGSRPRSRPISFSVSAEPRTACLGRSLRKRKRSAPEKSYPFEGRKAKASSIASSYKYFIWYFFVVLLAAFDRRCTRPSSCSLLATATLTVIGKVGFIISISLGAYSYGILKVRGKMGAIHWDPRHSPSCVVLPWHGEGGV